MIKKLLPLTLGLWLLLMLCGSALAAEPIIDQQQAIDAAKKLLPEIIGDKQLVADYRDDEYQGTGVWYLRTQSDKPLRGGPPNEIGIEINATNGSLIGLYYYNSEESTGGQQLVDRNQAREIAYNFLKKVQPGILHQIKLEDNSSSPYYYRDSSLNLTYSFHWNRLVNGLPVQEDGVYVTVDAISAKITHFNANWHENVTFPAPGNNLIKPEELTNLVVEKLGLYPTYSISPFTAPNQKAHLVYAVNTNASSFDGVTGKPVYFDGSIKEFSEGKLFNQIFTPEIGGGEIPAASQNTGQISPVKAQSIAEEFFKNMGYSGKVVRGGSGSESGPGYRIEYWDYQIETGEGEDFSDSRNMSVSIDSSSGRIAGFNTGPERIIDKSNNPISYEQARVSAERFVQKLGIPYPVIMQQDDTLLRATEPYRFNFVRLLHGAPCDLSGIYVGIDRYSGKVVDFHSRFMTASIPKLEQIISPDEATKIFKENQPFELAYTFTRDKSFRPKGNAQLVYVLKNFGQGIDAVTGKLLSGENASDARPTFNNHCGS